MRPNRIRQTRLSRRIAPIRPLVAMPPVTSNLYAWYDASAVNGLFAANPATDGTALASWKDLSGNGRDLSQATSANQPLFRNASRNLLTYNSGATCEDGTHINDFTSNTNLSTIVASTDVTAAYGAYSLKVTTSTATTNWSVALRTSGFTYLRVPAVQGDVFSACYSIQPAAGVTVQNARSFIRFVDASGATLRNDQSPATPEVAGTWTNVSWTSSAAPANTAYVTLILGCEANTSGAVHYFDKIGLFAGTNATWTPPVTLLNNQPTVQFDGNLQTIFISSLTLAQPFTIYAVARAESLGNTTSTSDRYIFGSSAGAKISYQRGGGSQPGRAYANAGTGFPAVTGTTMTTSSVVSYVFDNTSQSFRVNGVAGTAANAGANGLSGNLLMGGASTANTGFMGGIAAVLVYSAAHDTTTRQSIERWLGARYGITVA